MSMTEYKPAMVNAITEVCTNYGSVKENKTSCQET